MVFKCCGSGGATNKYVKSKLYKGFQVFLLSLFPPIYTPIVKKWSYLGILAVGYSNNSTLIH